MSYTAPLDGTIHLLPFDGGSLPVRIRNIYAAAIEGTNRSPRDVLVLKRLPNEVPAFTAALRDAVGIEARPNVKSVARHASMVLGEARPRTTRISYEQRIEFLARVIADHDWSPYFERASAHDSFGSDVGEVLLDATWQGGFDTAAIGETRSDEYLRELVAVNQRFHDELGERDLAEQAQTVPLAVKALDASRVRERIEREFETIIAVEFEEYSAVERAYLASLSRNADLVCVAERDASIERVKRETGSVERFTEGLSVVEHGTDDPSHLAVPSTGRSMAGHAFAAFLATGEVDGDSRDATARVIDAPTMDREVETVANEIGYLRYEHGWEYDDFAVLLRSVGDPIPRVRRVLRRSGVPTATVGVGGLEDDLAVRELHALARYLADRNHRARELLAARVPDLDDRIEACVDRSSLAASLERWVVTTDLKARVANRADDIDAREGFRNVSRVLDMAAFVDEYEFLSNTWEGFVTMVERAITYDAPYAHTAGVSVPAGGVTVGDVSLLKNDSRKAVFLINVTDAEYPGDHRLTNLFPTAWIEGVDGYPAVTNPSARDVTETFETASNGSHNEFACYHDQRARRQLAVGARAAEEHLYFCTYRTAEAGSGKPRHESRYLAQIRDHPALDVETIDGDDRDAFTAGSEAAEILGQPWAELERVAAVGSRGGNIDLRATEETFAAIQELLETDESVHPRFARAVDTQFDLARGAVRPQDRSSGASDGE